MKIRLWFCVFFLRGNGYKQNIPWNNLSISPLELKETISDYWSMPAMHKEHKHEMHPKLTPSYKSTKQSTFITSNFQYNNNSIRMASGIFLQFGVS
jgi:hypothetical protein